MHAQQLSGRGFGMSAVAEGQGGPAQEAAAGPAAGSDGYQRVASLEELQRAGRKRVRVGGEEGRAVVVFHVEGKLYALDYFCYRERPPLTPSPLIPSRAGGPSPSDTGGPLDQGDIEEVGERLCVVCPWHRHSITMDTGESLYTSIDPLRPHTPHHIRSKGVKQVGGVSSRWVGHEAGGQGIKQVGRVSSR